MPREWAGDRSGIGRSRAAARSPAWPERTGVGAGEGSEARPEGVLAPASQGPLPKPRRLRVPVRGLAEKPVS